MVLVVMLNNCVMAVAAVKFSVDGQEFDSCSEAACQRIIELFRELERVSSNDEGINITINVTHGSGWSFEKGFDALKSYGKAGIDYLMPYGLKGLDYLKRQGGQGWQYIKDCGEKGLNFLRVCGQDGLEYILSEGADGWEYLKSCGDAGFEFLKSLGKLSLYLLLKSDQFPYFVNVLGPRGLELLMPYAEEALSYLTERGAAGFEYLKKCGLNGLEYLRECGNAGLDYVLSFGKAGLDYLLSFGEDGWNFLMSYYNPETVVSKLSKDIPALKQVSPKDDRLVKNYLETYRTLGRDPVETYGKDALDVLKKWPGKSSKAPKHEDVIKVIMPDTANIYKAHEVKKFLEADALEWIDFVSDFKDKDHFSEGSLTFSREYPNSLSSYGFIDRDNLKDTVRKLYGGGFSIKDERRFMFKLSGSTILWNNTVQSTGEGAFFSLKTLKPGKAGDVISLALQLLQTVKTTRTGKNSAIRLFFRTDNEAVRVVAVIREGVQPTYYLAANKPLLERHLLVRTLLDSEKIALDSSMEELTFTLVRSDDRLRHGTDLDTCLNIFIDQLISELEGRK